MNEESLFTQDEHGILIPKQHVEPFEEEYDFEVLRDMQSRHFWYLGRHRFILHALKRFLRSAKNGQDGKKKAIDLGGGCGGWIQYLKHSCPETFSELALADSSVKSLMLAGSVLEGDVKRYQIDLLSLPWQEQWDVIFILDVLEHIPNDREAVQADLEVLRPGGCVVITTPALKSFWTYNDDLAHHVRRYSRKDFVALANDIGFEVCFTRYFMFFLSPLLLLSRWFHPNLTRMSKQEILEHLKNTHRVPTWFVNQTLRLVFSLESPLGTWLPLPWGTSVLAVLQRPQRPEA